MKNVVLMSHDNASRGSKELAGALHIRKLKHQNSLFQPSPEKTIINWGCSDYVVPGLDACKVLNPPEIVTKVINKRTFFSTFEQQAAPELKELIVPWTTDEQVVMNWFEKGYAACARQKLTGHGGEGLVIFDGACDFVQAPLYTQYIKKKAEFRVHVSKKNIFCIQQKKRTKDGPDGPVADHAAKRGQIRNLANGYIFARHDIEPPPCVLTAAVHTCAIMGFDFGAVDILWNQHYDRAWVLEVNTAPGLQGSTIDDYTNMLKGLL